jgi:hypothetical protein
MWVRHNTYLACLGASPALVLAGCAPVGGLLDVLWLERVDEHLRCSARAAALQGKF